METYNKLVQRSEVSSLPQAEKDRIRDRAKMLSKQGREWTLDSELSVPSCLRMYDGAHAELPEAYESLKAHGFYGSEAGVRVELPADQVVQPADGAVVAFKRRSASAVGRGRSSRHRDENG